MTGLAAPIYGGIAYPAFLGSFADMSAGRLLFAGIASAYIVVAVRFEEHDLRAHLGEAYERYAEEVPRFMSHLGSGLASAAPQRTH